MAQGRSHHDRHAYPLLALNLVVSFIAMYLVMFAMIDGWGDVD